MTDFLLELRSEEIPARMQARARDDLAKLFLAELAAAGLPAPSITTFATPRRLSLIARDLPLATAAVSEEIKGPKVAAPPQALHGFLRKTGLMRDQLVERDGVLFAVIDKPGRATAELLAEAIPRIIRAFAWPKSMRWGAASLSTESMRWVRPLQGIVALLDSRPVNFSVSGIDSGRDTVGHRFHSTGMISIDSAATYIDQLRDAHVIVDQDERANIIAVGAKMAARKAGLTLIEDAGLLAENAGLTEWPVPLLGRFDAEFLTVPPEVIQLTARVNQKYFVCADADGKLANAFVCTANIDAADGGAKIVDGNRKVLAARLSDAKFFYDTDLKVELEDQATKLDRIVFHEKLGTVADKVARVAKLARWLVEQGIVTEKPLPFRGGGGVGALPTNPDLGETDTPHPNPSPEGEGLKELANLAERAAMLCKADLVTGMVGEFPELQGVIGGYYAAAQGEDPRVAAAIRDHYKPVGQGDDVPTDPVTVAVSLADKLDTLFAFFSIDQGPTGSRDPFALRRQGLGILSLASANNLRLPLEKAVWAMGVVFHEQYVEAMAWDIAGLDDHLKVYFSEPMARNQQAYEYLEAILQRARYEFLESVPETSDEPDDAFTRANQERRLGAMFRAYAGWHRWFAEWEEVEEVVPLTTGFLADRLKVQQREAGVRHDLIDAVFALGGEDDLVRLLARVHALQAFIGTADGANLLAGYKRAANILKKEAPSAPSPQREFRVGLRPAVQDQSGGLVDPKLDRGEGGEGAAEPTLSTAGHPHPNLSLKGEGLAPAEAALIAALDVAEPAATAAVAREDFEAAMAALASLRAPIDGFFEGVVVNDPDPDKRAARLRLLARVRAAVHGVADFSKIEG